MESAIRTTIDSDNVLTIWLDVPGKPVNTCTPQLLAELSAVIDSLAKEKVDITARLKVEQIGDPVAARKRNSDAMSALVAAYPELRKGFHGVWVFAEAPGQNPYATELAMNEIH